MKLPNFVIAGFPKCGSTSMHYYLEEHPEIFLPRQKELHYFSYEKLKKLEAGKDDAEAQKFWVSSLKEYKQHYNEANSEKAVGDVSPSYANHDSAIEKIKKTLGTDVKVILMLRDPVRRAYSNYLHLVREGRETLSFYEALLAEDNRKKAGYSDFWYYAYNSDYYEKLERVKSNFDNVLVVTFEEFMKNPVAGIKEVYEFLEVDTAFIPQNLGTKFNTGGVYKENPITKFIFRQSKLKTFIKRLLPISSGMKKAKLKVIEKYREETPEIPKEAKEYLTARFGGTIEKLNKEFGVKTELWNEHFNLTVVEE